VPKWVKPHLRWEADYPPSQPVGSGFEPHWRPQPAKLPRSAGTALQPYLKWVKIGPPSNLSFNIQYQFAT